MSRIQPSAARLRRIAPVALGLALMASWPGDVHGWGTLTGGAAFSPDEASKLRWLFQNYGLDPARLVAEMDARGGAHPIHQFIVHEAHAIVAADPAYFDDHSGLPTLAAINAWDGIERCEEGMRQRADSGLVQIPALTPDPSGPSADAELDQAGGWNPVYDARAHYWNPWLLDGGAPEAAGLNYARLVRLIATQRQEARRAHFASYLGHYVADAVSAKHGDAFTLDAATLGKLDGIAKRWVAAPHASLDDWLASPILDEGVKAIQDRVAAIQPGAAAAYWKRVGAHIGDIGGTTLVQRTRPGALAFVSIPPSTLRTALAAYLSDLAARPAGKPLGAFYAYFDPFYYNGPLLEAAGDPPTLRLAVPLSEHMAWETNPAQFALVKAQLGPGAKPGKAASEGVAQSIVGTGNPESFYLPWTPAPGFGSFDETQNEAALRRTLAALVERCAKDSHGDIDAAHDFALAFEDPLKLAIRCVATAYRGSITALRAEAHGRLVEDGTKARIQLDLTNRAPTPATLRQARVALKNAAGKLETRPGWVVDLGKKTLTPPDALAVGITVAGLPPGAKVEDLVVDVQADFGTLPDSGRWRTTVAPRERRIVHNPGAETVLAQKGPADVIVVFDTTGSMQSALDAMRDNAIASIRALQAETKDIRLAVVTFGDFAPGDDGAPFSVRPFTRALDEQFAYLKTLKAKGGGDTAEDQLHALSLGLQLWETETPDPDRVPSKIIVVVTDAPAHVPDKRGNDFQTIARRAKAVDPASIYPIVIGDDPDALAHAEALARATDGKVLRVRRGDEVAKALQNAVATAVVAHPAPPAGAAPLGLWVGAVAALLILVALVILGIRLRHRRGVALALGVAIGLVTAVAALLTVLAVTSRRGASDKAPPTPAEAQDDPPLGIELVATAAGALAPIELPAWSPAELAPPTFDLDGPAPRAVPGQGIASLDALRAALANPSARPSDKPLPDFAALEKRWRDRLVTPAGDAPDLARAALFDPLLRFVPPSAWFVLGVDLGALRQAPASLRELAPRALHAVDATGWLARLGLSDLALAPAGPPALVLAATPEAATDPSATLFAAGGTPLARPALDARVQAAKADAVLAEGGVVPVWNLGDAGLALDAQAWLLAGARGFRVGLAARAADCILWTGALASLLREERMTPVPRGLGAFLVATPPPEVLRELGARVPELGALRSARVAIGVTQGLSVDAWLDLPDPAPLVERLAGLARDTALLTAGASTSWLTVTPPTPGASPPGALHVVLAIPEGGLSVAATLLGMFDF